MPLIQTRLKKLNIIREELRSIYEIAKSSDLQGNFSDIFLVLLFDWLETSNNDILNRTNQILAYVISNQSNEKIRQIWSWP